MSSAARAPAELPTISIEPSSGWAALRLRDLWDYRELLYFFVWRDVKVRYKQTLLGAAWAILQPLTTMFVFTVFFGRLAKVGSDGLPYPVFSFAGLLPWIFFADGLNKASGSMVGDAALIQKIYFPRLLLPISSVLGGLVDFAIAFVVLLVLMVFYGIWPTATVVFLPLMLIIAVGSALGVGMWLAALNVRYRDVRFIVPFFVQIWLFITPVIYPSGRVTAKLASMGLPGWIYGINPMAGVVEGFRWSLLGVGTRPGALILTSTLVMLLLLFSGAFYFRRMERTFADVV
jgi:lipopolysaccharide transport system permease protein